MGDGALFISWYVECHFAECHYAECHYAECRYAECRGAVETSKIWSSTCGSALIVWLPAP